MNENGHRHPGAQTMADFVDGTLPRNEIAVVAGHLSGCAECRTVVAETARFEREEPRRASRASWLAAAAMIAAALVTVPLMWNRPSSDPIARLVDAAPADHRILEPRLARFRWARLQPPSRGVDATPDPADLKLSGTAGDVLQKTLDRDDAGARHASGVAYLLIGRAGESVAALERATQGANGWQAWNDLAAARYALATGEKRPSQLPQALADVDRALHLAPKSAEAHFNRALILEAMGLYDAAREAWERYLALDPASEWSNEARAHLRRLQPHISRFDPKMLETMRPDAVVRQFPQEVRRWGLALLADWADAEAHDEARATMLLARARAIGDALARFKSERMLSDAVTAIERGDRAALAAAHRTYRDARLAYRDRRPGDAEKEFRRAADSFARNGSPMAGVASYYAAQTAFDQGRGDEARRALTDLLARVDSDRHAALRAEIEWELTVCANAAGDWGSAVRYATAAAARFRSLGEQVFAHQMDGYAAMATELIGERDLAWQLRIRTFAGLSGTGQRQLLAPAVHGAAITLDAIGRTEAAASIMDVLTPNNLDAAIAPYYAAESARYAASSGDFPRAQEALGRARVGVALMRDRAMRETVSAQIALADATTGQGGAALDRGIQLFATGNARLYLPEAYLQRARMRRAASDERGALADYAAALEEVEKQRTTIHDGEQRLRFLDVAAHIIEETVDLRIAQHDVAGAFEVADRARAWIDPRPMNARTTAVPALREGVLVVEYLVLPQRTIAFCISRDGIAAESIPLARHELETRVSTFAERMRRRVGIEELRAEAAALHRTLIAPLRTRLVGMRELVIVPDRQLHALPFAALWNDVAKQYLVEEFTLRFAPAATLARNLASASPAQILVIADPPAAANPPLPQSREEAGAIAAMYGGATLLEGEAATRDAFLQHARNSTLIHFAGHANSDATSSHGALLFAASGGDSGILGSSEVAQLRFEHAPLVVLAACGTLRGALHVSGMSSLSRAFFAAGARGVVGTLWEIDDDVSAQLFRRFHAHLRGGMSAAEALRAAQIDQLRSPDARLGHPASWSPVELLTDV
jgi:CHAT domain-containing protein